MQGAVGPSMSERTEKVGESRLLTLNFKLGAVGAVEGHAVGDDVWRTVTQGGMEVAEPRGRETNPEAE